MATRTAPYYSMLPLIIGGGIVVSAYALIHLGAALTPGDRTLSLNPLVMVIQLATGESAWPAAATWLLVAFAVVLMLIVLLLFVRPTSRERTARPKKDTAEDRLSRDRSGLSRVLEKERAKEAAQLHPGQEFTVSGIQIGRALSAGRPWVLQSFRQCSVHVWGPGRGKTTSEVIRHAFYAPGPYAMTSNKPDGVREVIAARAATFPTGRVWLLDPDRIFQPSGRPTFTFDLLASVKDSGTAMQLAEVFETATQKGSERGDVQFDPTGRQYLAWLLLAAATAGKPLTQVHSWVTEGAIGDPQEILVEAGHRGPAAALAGMTNQPEKTRFSVVATAQRMAAPMVHDYLMDWVLPRPGVPAFSPEHFATSEDTLIMLSAESAGASAAFVSGLVRMIFEAARAIASASTSERLPRPLIADLDECGNVVRLKDLPEWYTHFGSKGILINAYFQSPAQGEEMFGRTRFKQLWDAAGMRVYGGGIDDPEWLGQMSKLFGTYEKQSTSQTSSVTGPRSESTSTHEADRISVAELSNLGEWRAVVRTANGVSTIVETVPVFRDKAFSGVIAAAEQMRQAGAR